MTGGSNVSNLPNLHRKYGIPRFEIQPKERAPLFAEPMLWAVFMILAGLVIAGNIGGAGKAVAGAVAFVGALLLIVTIQRRN